MGDPQHLLIGDPGDQAGHDRRAAHPRRVRGDYVGHPKLSPLSPVNGGYVEIDSAKAFVDDVRGEALAP